MSTGVDLSDSAQRTLIDRIFWARFAPMVRAKGLDPEDCLQEVYRGFLTRNLGGRPFDAQTATLSTYGYIVCRSVTFNFLDHHRRAAKRLGMVGAQQDAATWAYVETGEIAPLCLAHCRVGLWTGQR